MQYIQIEQRNKKGKRFLNFYWCDDPEKILAKLREWNKHIHYKEWKPVSPSEVEQKIGRDRFDRMVNLWGEMTEGYYYFGEIQLQ